jgi:hypothetical protein
LSCCVHDQIQEGVAASEAVMTLDAEGCTQPVLFVAEGRSWIKLDHQAMPVCGDSCITDSIELLFMTFFVFNVDFPHELRLVYGFLEQLLLLKPSVGHSVAIRQLMASVKA